MKNLEKIIEVAENLGWNVSVDKEDKKDTYICFSQYSPAGQDFNLELTYNDAESLVEEVRSRYEDFDVSYETYLWLGDDGHGKNGAPYDMKDLYEDMEECEKMIEELADELEKIEFEEEYEDEEENND